MATDVGFAETFALAQDRAAALKRLVPGTADYYRYTVLHLLNSMEQGGARDRSTVAEIEQLMSKFAADFGAENAVYGELHSRFQVLRYDAGDTGDQEASLRYICETVRPNWTHARNVTGADAPAVHPSVLDERAYSTDALMREELVRSADNLAPFSDAAADWLAANARDKLTPRAREQLLRRIRRPGVPHLVELVADDLGRQSARFGALPAHQVLTLAQLDKLRDAKPDIVHQQAFVEAYMARLLPSDDVAWERLPVAARQAYYERVWDFVSRSLPPAMNSIRANVLANMLRFLRDEMDRFDERHFLAYLELPKRSPSARSEYAQQPKFANSVADLSWGARQLHLPPAGDDSELIESFLAHLFARPGCKAYKPYDMYLQQAFVQRIFAKTKLLSGAPDAAKYSSMLGDADALEQLRDSVELQFDASNAQYYFDVDALVRLSVWVKNVPQLMVKLFDIDTPNYYRARHSEIQTNVDLDGLVANYEMTYQYADPPILRVRRTIELPLRARRGVFVVELIGNGVSSRAVIRKGQLRFTVRPTVAGHLVAVFDETAQRVRGPSLSLFVGSTEFPSNADTGDIIVPYTSAARKETAIIVYDGFAALQAFEHQTENYTLVAGMHVPREALVAGNHRAQVLIRAKLYLNAVPVGIAAVEDWQLTLETASDDGVRATRHFLPPALAVRDDEDSVVEFAVPEALRQIRLTLTGHVRLASAGKGCQDLTVTKELDVNGINDSATMHDAYLEHADGQYWLCVLGRSGEARPRFPCVLSLKHRMLVNPVQRTVQTDADGRVRLGTLPQTEWMMVSGTDLERRWTIEEASVQTRYPSVLHALEGEPMLLPLPAAIDPARPPVVASWLSLVETRGSGDVTVNDVTSSCARLDAASGCVRLENLPAGNYVLTWTQPTVQSVRIAVTAGTRALNGRLLCGQSRYIECPRGSRPPLAIAGAAEESPGIVCVRLHGHSARTRVHVTSARFVHAPQLADDLAQIVPSDGAQLALPPPRSYYLSNRPLGEEHRYILERNLYPRRPGNMLPRPGVLLAPWALRTTETHVKDPRAGGGYAAVGDTSVSGASAPALRRMAGAANLSNACVDFVAPARLLANLRPDRDGVVRVRVADELARFGSDRLYVVAVDDEETVWRVLDLRSAANKRIPIGDLRLLRPLQAPAHFAELYGTEIVRAQATYTVRNLSVARLELYDVLDKAFRLFQTLSSNDATLSEFDFVLRWHRMTVAEKDHLMSRYMCHELAFYVYHKDRAYFDERIKPHLRHKRDKMFMDEWLLGSDATALRPYLDPWNYARLNALERILLAERLGAEELERAVRQIKDDSDASRAPEEERQRRFEVALRGSSLDSAAPPAEMTPPVVAAALEEADAAALSADEEENAMASFGTGLLRASDAARADLLPAGAARRAVPAPAPMMMMMASAMPGGRAAMMRPMAAMATRKMVRRTAELKKETAAASADDDSDDDHAESEQMPSKDTAEEAEREEETKYLQQLRAKAVQLYEPMAPTSEWGEQYYYRRRPRDTGSEVIKAGPFWYDYAARDRSAPFLSTSITEVCSNGFTEMMMALSVLDLPLAADLSDGAPGHHMDYAESSLTMTAASDLLVFSKQISEVPEGSAMMLVHQRYFEGDPAAHRDDANEAALRADEMRIHTPYGVRVVVMNAGMTKAEVSVLMQIPAGAVPLRGGTATRSRFIELAPYSMQSLDYMFYFPQPGVFAHYPAHVTHRATCVGYAQPASIRAVERLTEPGTPAWSWLSQEGSDADVLRFLQNDSLRDADLTLIAWRCKDDARFFAAAVAALRARHVYCSDIWAYGLKHRDVRTIAEFLRFSQLPHMCGPELRSTLLTYTAFEQLHYEHLEYAPLVNARAHRLGKERSIVNPCVAEQYTRTLRLLCFRHTLGARDVMVLLYFMFLFDRVDDAMALLARLQAEIARAPVGQDMQLQMDYLAAYLDMYTPERGLSIARAHCQRYASYANERWRRLFLELADQLREIDAAGAVAGSGDGAHDDDGRGEDTGLARDRRQAAASAAAPSMSAALDGKQIVVTYQNPAAAECLIRYYAMDTELLFSSNPFVQHQASRFALIKPNMEARVPAPTPPASAIGELRIPLPPQYETANALIDIALGTQRKSLASFAHRMVLHVTEHTGQLRVVHRDSGLPLAAAYVKVYAKHTDGRHKVIGAPARARRPASRAA